MKTHRLSVSVLVAGQLFSGLLSAQTGKLAVPMSEARITVENRADRDTVPDFQLEIAFNSPGLSITMHD